MDGGRGKGMSEKMPRFIPGLSAQEKICSTPEGSIR